MVKSIFIGFYSGDVSLKELSQTGANHLIVVLERLKKAHCQMLTKTGFPLGISFCAFDDGGCPLDPEAKAKLLQRAQKAPTFKPAEIWLDHFRFDGHWEAIKNKWIPGVHQGCRRCRGQDRVKALVNLSQEVKKMMPKGIKLGYFAVPFKETEVPELVSGLGHDHGQLAKNFDLLSPMLYHRMIRKPVKYIHDYVVWLKGKTQKPILPIIQVKDMPGDLPDELSEAEIEAAFKEAAKSPSIGVAFFCWDHAIEKKKSELIPKLFRKTNTSKVLCY